MNTPITGAQSLVCGLVMEVSLLQTPHGRGIRQPAL